MVVIVVVIVVLVVVVVVVVIVVVVVVVVVVVIEVVSKNQIPWGIFWCFGIQIFTSFLTQRSFQPSTMWCLEFCFSHCTNLKSKV